MAKVKRETLEETKDAFERYKKAVNGSSGLTEKTKKTYISYVDQFVRWLDDDFEPGGGRGP